MQNSGLRRRERLVVGEENGWGGAALHGRGISPPVGLISRERTERERESGSCVLVKEERKRDFLPPLSLFKKNSPIPGDRILIQLSARSPTLKEEQHLRCLKEVTNTTSILLLLLLQRH